MRNEMMALRRRVEDLEDAMGHRSSPHKQINGVPSNSIPSVPAPEPAYTFPPASSSSQDPSSSRGLRPENSKPELSRRTSNQAQLNDHRHSTETGRASPAPSRRLGVSGGSSMQSPPQMYRERDAPPIAISSTSRPPPLSRQNSSSNSAAGVPMVVVTAERERERTPPPPTSSRRAPGSRRDSVVMTGPGEGS
jgi:hypothetical protein